MSSLKSVEKPPLPVIYLDSPTSTFDVPTDDDLSCFSSFSDTQQIQSKACFVQGKQQIYPMIRSKSEKIDETTAEKSDLINLINLNNCVEDNVQHALMSFSNGSTGIVNKTEKRCKEDPATLGLTTKQCTQSKKTHHRSAMWKSFDSTIKTGKDDAIYESPHFPMNDINAYGINQITSCKRVDFIPKEDGLFLPSLRGNNASPRRLFSNDTVNHRQTRSDSFLNTKNILADGTLRTSEHEPSPHQVQLPTLQEVLTCAHLCGLLEEYRVIDKHFDFSYLIGMSSQAMLSFLNTGFAPLNGNLTCHHKSIIQNLLNCGGDFTVEGSFMSGNVTERDQRVEVVVFKSERQRKIMLAWRGTTGCQKLPIQSKYCRTARAFQNEEFSLCLPFCEFYLRNEVESKLFHLLDRLMDENPFFDLFVTGHSFGAALATICGTRYASFNPIIRASCIVFGSPKVGGDAWRRYVHSFSNVKVARVENGTEPWTCFPSHEGFTHVGHTILLQRPPEYGGKSPSCGNSKVKMEQGQHEILAIKFGREAKRSSRVTRPSRKSFVRSKLPMAGHGGKRAKQVPSVHSHIRCLLECPPSLWPTTFVGEDAHGRGTTETETDSIRMVV